MLVRQLFFSVLLFSGASATELPSLITILSINPKTLEDAYKLFNVTPDISDKELRDRRRQLVLKYQPRATEDVDDVAAHINAAYTLITQAREAEKANPTAQPERQDPDFSLIRNLLKLYPVNATYFLPGQLADLTERYLNLSPVELSHLFDDIQNVHFSHPTRITGFIVDEFSTERMEKMADQLSAIWKQYSLWQNVHPLHYKRQGLKSPVTLHDVLRPRLERLSTIPRTHYKDLSERNWPRSFWLDKVRQTKNLIVCYKMKHDEESLASLQRIVTESEALQKSFFHYRTITQAAQQALDEMLRTYPLEPPSYGTGRLQKCGRLILPFYNQIFDRFLDRKSDDRPTYEAFRKPWQEHD